jgi:phosphatidate cytidylyltransferase
LQWQAFIWIIIAVTMLTLVVELFRNNGSAILNVAVTLLGVFYIGMFLGCALGIREIFTSSEFPVSRVFGTIDLSAEAASTLRHWGGATVVSLLAGIWICDTAAFFGGTALGKHKLFPRVSPKKSWEGAAFGFVGAVVAMIAARYLALEYLSLTHAIVIGVMIGTIGQIGDLVESLFKRDAGIKDSSELIPGHGGVFDRFDSFILLSPAIFLYLDFIVFA